ncbi:MAG: bifunctional folylpolyglutamate synthase/dihydrofolate synthase [Chloroflexota bacterium]
MSAADDLLWSLAVPTRAGERPDLERMRRLLFELGDPHHGLPVLHIGGTSGKGSTATIAARILREAGYRVGLHVKPHLEAVEERVVVDGKSIEPARLVALLDGASAAARKVGPSWYELTVALAFQHFRAEQVDVAVVEVGLGGTYDGTNVVEPRAVVLTNVDLDHVEVLGDTVEKIASDKVGIIKPGVPVVCGTTQDSVRKIVAARCEAMRAPLWALDRELRYRVGELGPDGARFDLDLPERHLADLRIGLQGAHQVANAALAVAAVEALRSSGFSVGETALRRGLAAVAVPGRLEVARARPLVLLDGAHNPAKMTALTEALRALYPGRPLTGVLAFKRGHDLPQTLAPLAPMLRRAVFTRFDAATDYGRDQSVDPATVLKTFQALDATAEATVEPDPIRAIDDTLERARPDDLICVTGSLYLIGKLRPWLRERR